MQFTQKKSIKLNSRHHIGAKEFEETNWLPIKEKGRTMHYLKSLNIERKLHHSM